MYSCICHPHQGPLSLLSVNTSASQRNPQRRERGKCRYIRCQKPTAEIYVATHSYGCIFKSIPSSPVMLAASDTHTHIFLVAFFLHNHPCKTKTVRAISLSTLTACRGCISESNVEFSALGNYKLAEGGWKDQKQIHFYDCNIPQFKKKKTVRILKLAIPFSLFLAFFFFF